MTAVGGKRLFKDSFSCFLEAFSLIKIKDNIIPLKQLNATVL